MIRPFSLSLSLCIGASCLWPALTAAQPMELSQAQLRALVAQQDLLSAEAVIADVKRDTGGTVMDIRGFVAGETTTYRLLLQGTDGAIWELLVDGRDGSAVDLATPHGQVISAVARGKQ